jgi:TonB-dependent starch-binding outer membrane protein SusC
VYVNALNLLTFAANDIFDPEADNGGGVYYPQSRTLNTGLSLTF